MKKVILLFFISLFYLNLQAQLSFGIKGGLSTSDISPPDLAVMNSESANNLTISVKEADYGVHIGFFLRGQMGETFFIQPEINFNSINADYQISDFSNNFDDMVFRESYRNLDIPILLGFKFGPLRLNGGPVGHLNLSNKTSLDDVPGIEERFENLKYGWQAGIGLDIWRLTVDLRYEGNFDNFGDHLVINDTPYSFNQKPNRLIVSLGYMF